MTKDQWESFLRGLWISASGGISVFLEEFVRSGKTNVGVLIAMVLMNFINWTRIKVKS